MQYAVYQAEWRRRRSARIWVIATIILGVAFLGNQAYEWLFSPTRWYTNSYGSLFYIMSGLHGLHVFIGLLAMTFFLGRMRGTRAVTPASCRRCRASPTTGTSSTSSGSGSTVACSSSSRHARRRTPHRGTLRSQFLLPAGLLAVAAMTSLAMFFPATDAGASGHSDAAQVSTTATARHDPIVWNGQCEGSHRRRAQRGNPFNSSSRFVSTGISSPTAAAPSPTPTRRSRSSPPAACCSRRRARAATATTPTEWAPTVRPRSDRICKGSGPPRSTSGSAPAACPPPIPRRSRRSGASPD